MKKVIVFTISLIIIFCMISGLLVLYPIKYKVVIMKYAKEYDLSSGFVASVINIESHYDNFAKSQAGAMGLMQIMPTTAEEIASKLGRDFKINDLYDVETNIEFGCYYLSYLFDYFDGNIINVLSGYNWGINNVRNWLNNGNIDKEGSVINLPVKETRGYIKKFKFNRWVYDKIYKY